ncbi:MAG: trypsin-like serine protease [Chloroflexi bacterium]|nr:MAG: trypsin-like serine protease [Chloroflexota bacterium]
MTTGARPRPTTVLVLLVLLAALGAGAITAEIVLGGQSAHPLAGTSSPSLTAASGGGATAMAPTAIYQQASKGVVTIDTHSGNGSGRGAATGSGIVLDHNGNILTNNHVIQGAGQVQVTFSDGSTANATIVNTNAAQDLATLHVSVAAASLHPLTLGNSNNVLIGDTAYAIGAPFGHPESMSAGIISGLNRTDPTSGLHGLIQTDARINPGNSGGPLLNTLGQVIGINDAIESPIEGSVGVGFAIPINSARPQDGGNF